jgi:hypothetical protein
VLHNPLKTFKAKQPRCLFGSLGLFWFFNFFALTVVTFTHDLKMHFLEIESNLYDEGKRMNQRETENTE